MIPQEFSMLEILGLSGTLSVALCSIPQVYESIKLGRTGMNTSMIILWNVGVIQMFIYTIVKTKDVFIYGNYGASILFSSIILYYKLFPRL